MFLKLALTSLIKEQIIDLIESSLSLIHATRVAYLPP